MPRKARKLQITRTDNMLDIRLSSHLENIDAACRVVTRYLLHRLAAVQRPDQLFAVNLVMREGLTNAVRHGNKNDITKDVRLTLKIVDGVSLCMEIEDQGNGFDWRKHKGSELPLAADHGRGIPIMKTYFTRYAYNEKGNILFLHMDFTSRI
ncbi:MAG: ATP-binding protein [Desulfotignum sp.]|nr:ATP-binding protein [Desulfotignum sp.]